MARERQPERIGAVSVVCAPLAPEEGDPVRVQWLAPLEVAPVEDVVGVALGMDEGGTIVVSLNTKQAYHLAMAILRARARALRVSN